MKKILIIISFLVGMSLKAQTKQEELIKQDLVHCVQVFFDDISDMNEIMPGETADIDKVEEYEKMYKGEFFNFNGLKDVRFNEFLTYYKTYVLKNAKVTHKVIDLDFKPSVNAPESRSYRLSNVKIRRTFKYQSSQSSAIRPYSDTITCSILVTRKGKNDYPSISINGISYTEPLEKTPQVIAVRRTPILKVSKAFTSEEEAYRSIPDVLGAYRDIDGIDQYRIESATLVPQDSQQGWFAHP